MISMFIQQSSLFSKTCFSGESVVKVGSSLSISGADENFPSKWWGAFLNNFQSFIVHFLFEVHQIFFPSAQEHYRGPILTKMSAPHTILDEKTGENAVFGRFLSFRPETCFFSARAPLQNVCKHWRQMPFSKKLRVIC